jgi:hypothetical protein
MLGKLKTRWTPGEIAQLKELMETKTTKELEEVFPTRSRKAIERTIEKLRKKGELGYRNLDTIKKSYGERR